MDDKKAVEILKALLKVGGALHIPKRVRVGAAIEISPQPVVGLEGPDAAGLYTAWAEDGSRTVGTPSALLYVLQKDWGTVGSQPVVGGADNP